MSTLLAFHQHFHRAIGQLQHLQNGGDATDIKHVGHKRIVFGRRFLCDQHDAPVGLHGRLERLDAFRATHEKRDHHMRENHNVPQGEQWQFNRGGR